MNHFIRATLCITALVCGMSMHALPLRGKSFFSPRSQSTNAARNLAGLTPFVYNPDLCTNWSLWTVTAAYNQAFTTHRIAEYFFGFNTLRFTGSTVPNRADNDILADYFGLSTAFDGTVKLEPHMVSALADFRWYAGLDGIAKGLYATVYAPLVWCRSFIKLEEKLVTSGTSVPYPARYMSNVALQAPLGTINAAFARDILFGDVQEPLEYGRMDGAKSKTALADIHCVLGWNFLLQENGHVGINTQLVIPTGNHSKAVTLFEPIVGNGHHWEWGVGLNGHVRIWEKDGDQELCFYVDAMFSHLYKSKQRRSFDITKNGFGSRYILLKEFDETGAYTRRSMPAINKTTLDCHTWVSIQIDFILGFAYHYNQLDVEFGYNGWFRSREKIDLIEGLPVNRYGFKGIQNVTLPAGMPSSATESTATLHGTELANQAAVMDIHSPVFINTGNLDVGSAANTRGLSHKLYVHIQYAWECNRVDPFFGIGSEIEFEGVNPRRQEPNKDTLSQWGIWFKGGLLY